MVCLWVSSNCCISPKMFIKKSLCIVDLCSSNPCCLSISLSKGQPRVPPCAEGFRTRGEGKRRRRRSEGKIEAGFPEKTPNAAPCRCCGGPGASQSPGRGGRGVPPGASAAASRAGVQAKGRIPAATRGCLARGRSARRRFLSSPRPALTCLIGRPCRMKF